MRFFVLAVVYLCAFAPKAGSVSIEPPRLVFQTVPAPALRPTRLTFHVTIGKDGALHDIRHVSGPTALAPVARAVLTEWIYEPATIAGTPVEFSTTVDVVFSGAPKRTR